MLTDPRPPVASRGRPRQALLPALVVVAAALAVALDGPRWLTTVLAAAAFALTAERLVRRRQLGWADAVATSAAGLIVVLMLLGFLLDVMPGGIQRVSWAIGSGVVALIAIGWAVSRDDPGALTTDVDRHVLARLAPVYAVAVVLAAVALVISVHATRVASRAPVALSMVSSQDGRVAVEISGGSASGRYQLVVDGGTGVPTVYGPFAVEAGAHVRTTVRVPPRHRSVVSLRKVGSVASLRSLVVARAPADGSS